MSRRRKELNNQPPPEYESDSTLMTIKFHHWRKCESEPEHHYEGGEITVFDHVEISGISLFELDNLCEESAQIFGVKKYYILIEDIGFHRITSDRELHHQCVDLMQFSREIDLYIEVSFEEIRVLQMGDIGEDEDEDDESDPDYEYETEEFSGNDSDYDMDNDDDDYEYNVDKNSEWMGIDKQREYVRKKGVKNLRADEGTSNALYDSDSNLDNSESDKAPDSDPDLESIRGSDEEQCMRKHIVFNPKKDMDNPILECEMIFSNFKEFKNAVRNWNIKRGRPFKFVKSDKLRVRCKCPKEGCDWCIYARKMRGEGCVQVRTFQSKHKCGFSYHNQSVKSGWIGRKYSEEFRANPRLDLYSFRKQVMKENRCFISKTQGYRAKRTAFKIIRGSETDQYKKLNDYIHEIRRSNPGSTVIMKMVDGCCDGNTRQPKFERLYMCFGGVKQGFLVGCRSLFGIDGTFLKGPAGGILLTAVGIDPNNGFFPIAYAATEGETKDSWSWFLNLLKENLKIERDYEWTIMSDKQKGIIQACEAVFPNADHRFCVKHLQSNWSLAGYKGQALRACLWAAAKATTPAQFIRKIEEMADIDLDAAKWFDDKPAAEWSRSHFKTHPKCDILLNNICESFNSKILDARDQPIIGLMEGLRSYIRTRMQENRDRAKDRWRNLVYCPKILKRVKQNIDKATHCLPHKCNEIYYEVVCPYGETYSVNLEEKRCSCRKWDLTGISCSHAISALWIALKDPMDYIDDCYKVETYLKCYEPCIFPVNEEHEWEKTGGITPLPPSYGRAPGRPKKMRRKNEDEIQQAKEKKAKMRRVGQLNKCAYCNEKGHNKRSCKLRKKDEETHNSSEQAAHQLQIVVTESVHCDKEAEFNLEDFNDESLVEVLCKESFSSTSTNNKQKKIPAKMKQVAGRKRKGTIKSQKSTAVDTLEGDNVSCSAPPPDLHDVFGLPDPPTPYESQPWDHRLKGKMNLK